MSEFSYFQTRGWIEVVVGSMFSGKTEELIRRVRRAEYAKLKVQVFKPVIDNRYRIKEVTSHNQNTIDAIPLNDIEEIWNHLSPKTRVVGIDEGQFFDARIVNVVQDLADRGLRVIVAGLDTDWKGQAFEPMPTLMAIAENVSKQHAVCMTCGAPACRTQKIAGGDSQIEVGATESYEARCREHFVPRVESTKEASKEL